MSIVPDFSETKEPVPDVVPGIYKLRVLTVEHKVSKAGNEMLNWKFEICSHPKFAGQWVFDNTMTTGKGAYRLKNTLLSLNPLYKGGPFEIPQLLGKTMEAKLDYEIDARTGTRSPYIKIKQCYPLPESGAESELSIPDTGPNFTDSDIPF